MSATAPALRRRGLIGVVGLVFAFASAAMSLGNRADASTVSVSGSYSFSFTPLGCRSTVGITCYTGNMRGGIAGGLEAAMLAGTPTVPLGVFNALADVVVHTSTGDLRCTVNGVINTSSPDGEIAALCVITGGTHRWTGARGYLQWWGNTTPSPAFPAFSGSGEYRGKGNL